MADHRCLPAQNNTPAICRPCSPSRQVAIDAERVGPRNNAAPLRFLRPAFAAAPTAFSASLESRLHRVLANANQRKHAYATLEHLLLALIDEVDAWGVMKACKVDLAALKEHLVSSIDDDLKTLAIGDGESKTDRCPSARDPAVAKAALIPFWTLPAHKHFRR